MSSLANIIKTASGLDFYETGDTANLSVSVLLSDVTNNDLEASIDLNKLDIRHLIHPAYEGIPIAVALEKGLIRPGDVCAGELCLKPCGANGALGIESAPELRQGKFWAPYQVPEFSMVETVGLYEGFISQFDLMIELSRECLRDRNRRIAFEIKNPEILCFDNCFAAVTCSNIVHNMELFYDKSDDDLPSDIELIDIDPSVLSDAGNKKCAREIDLASLQHQLFVVSNNEVKAEYLEDLLGHPIDQAIVGGCSTGYYKDLAWMADAIRQAGIHHQLKLWIIPATKRTAMMALVDDSLGYMVDKGSIITRPECKECPLVKQPVGKNIITTLPVNNTLLAKDQKVFVTSLPVAIAAVMSGRLSLPKEVIDISRFEEAANDGE